MFVPLSDDNPLRIIETPYATRALILFNVAIFVLFQSGLVVDGLRASAVGFGVIPAELYHGAGLRDRYGVIPESLTVFTYMFLHGGWMHLLGNMLFLWVFGDNVEDAVGHVKFVAFYLACGAAAALAHAVSVPQSEAPLLGASGAVAGVVAAYLVLHPKVKLWVLMLGRIPLKLTAAWVIGAWIVFQVAHVVLGVDDGTAWWAHVGGLAAGVLLIPFLRRSGVPLFDRGLSAAPLAVDRETGRL